MNRILTEYILEIGLTLSDKTIQNNKYQMRKFIEWMNKNGLDKLTAVKRKHIVQYLRDIKGDYTQDSLSMYQLAISRFFKWALKTKKITENPCEDLEVIKREHTRKSVCSHADVIKVIESIKPYDFASARDRAIAELFYSSGPRVSELIELQLSDFLGESIRIESGKGAKTRTIPVNAAARKAIEEWIHGWRGTDEGYLFVTTRHYKGLRRSEVSKNLRLKGEVLGVKGLTPHAMRHAFATHMLDAGADLRLIQEVLGHSSITSTQRYTQVTAAEMQSRFKTFHPRG